MNYHQKLDLITSISNTYLDPQLGRLPSSYEGNSTYLNFLIIALKRKKA